MAGLLNRLMDQCNRVTRAGFIQQDKLKVFFIEKTQLDQGKIKFVGLRKQLQDKLGFSDDRCLQVIGDSNPFSVSGDRYAVALLQDVIKQHQGPILYGFTSNNEGGANGVVGKCLANDPQQVSKVIANMVHPMSVKAIKEWGCTYSEAVTNYLVVFDQTQDCHFGDDIVLSDNLAEELLCLEGGVISFLQVVNTLIYHKNPSITVIHGLRDSQPWFSAAEFFAKLKKAKRIDDLIQCKNNYLRDLRLNDSSAKPLSEAEAAAKTQQIDEAFAKLIEAEAILEKLKELKVNHYIPSKPIKIKAGWFQSTIIVDRDDMRRSLFPSPTR